MAAAVTRKAATMGLGMTACFCNKMQSRTGRSVMSQLEDLLRDLVVANRILSNEDVVDAYGHISVRHPDNPEQFFMSRSLAPELV